MSLGSFLWEALTSKKGTGKVIEEHIQEWKKEEEEARRAKKEQKAQEAQRARQQLEEQEDSFDTGYEPSEENDGNRKNSTSNKRAPANLSNSLGSTVNNWKEKYNSSPNKLGFIGKGFVIGGIILMVGYTAFTKLFSGGDAETETSKNLTALSGEENTDTFKVKVAKTTKECTIKVSAGLGGWRTEEEQIPAGAVVTIYLDDQENTMRASLLYEIEGQTINKEIDQSALETLKEFLSFYGNGHTINSQTLPYIVLAEKTKPEEIESEGTEPEETELEEVETEGSESSENKEAEGTESNKSMGSSGNAWPNQGVTLLPEGRTDGKITVYLDGLNKKVLMHPQSLDYDFALEIYDGEWMIGKVKNGTNVRTTPSSIYSADGTNTAYITGESDEWILLGYSDDPAFLETFEGNYIPTESVVSLYSINEQGIKNTGFNAGLNHTNTEEAIVDQIEEGSIAIGRTNKAVVVKKGMFGGEEYTIPAGSLTIRESDGTTTVYTKDGSYNTSEMGNTKAEDMDIRYSLNGEFMSENGEIPLYKSDGNLAKDSNGNPKVLPMGEKGTTYPFAELQSGKGYTLVPVKPENSDTTESLYVRSFQFMTKGVEQLKLEKGRVYYIAEAQASTRVLTTPYDLESGINLNKTSPDLSDGKLYVFEKDPNNTEMLLVKSPTILGTNWVPSSKVKILYIGEVDKNGILRLREVPQQTSSTTRVQNFKASVVAQAQNPTQPTVIAQNGTENSLQARIQKVVKDYEAGKEPI